MNDRKNKDAATSGAALGQGREPKRKTPFNVELFLSAPGPGKALLHFKKKQAIFTEGDRLDGVFYIQKGRIKLSITSKAGKEATLSLLGPGEFLGEESIRSEHAMRVTSATALTDCTLLRIAKEEMMRILHEEPEMANRFITFLLGRNARIQEDLVDQLFNSTEKRLARALLLLAQYGKGEKGTLVDPRVSQEALASMIGTTRSRVNVLMNRFKKMGFIHYDGELKVNSSLLSVILHD